MTAELDKQFGLGGSVAVVTGGGSGIGRAVALLYARLGALVAVIDENGAGVAQTVREIEAAGGAAMGHTLDVTDEAAMIAAFDAIAAARGGRIDILVNCAGIVMRVPSVDVPLESWRRVLDVNLTGVFLASRNAARHMIPRHSGCIVNIASIGGINAGTTGRQYPNASYRASKGGVVHLTRTLAVEWAAQGIRVNAVAPGYVRTPLTQPITSDPVRLKALEQTIPLGRMADPEDLAWAVIFLTSKASSLVTGQILAVDGGLLA